MKKFTILMVFVAFASFAMAQAIQAPSNIAYKEIEKDIRIIEKKTEKQAIKSNAAWSQDFEGITNWTVVANPNMALHKWKVKNIEGFMADGWGNFEDGWSFYPMADSATDPNKWVYIDVCSPALPGGAGAATIPTTLESYIRFDGIDLSNVPNPKLMWSQYFRPFNPPWIKLYVDVSVDGTNWTSYQVNQNISHGEYAEYSQSLLIPALANEPDVSLRFRWTHDKSSHPDYTVGYGWCIDDIMFVQTPDYDLKHLKTAMNFFVYVDYHTQPSGYHYSGHFGQIPISQMDTEASYMFFNTIVENKGLAEVTPEINVKVMSPDGTEVYTNTIAGTPIASGAIDTIDIIEPTFMLEIPISTGEYIVYVDVAVQGQEDANIDDNSYETKFFVTENGTYARDLDNITQSYGLAGWSNGGNNEEMLATNYFINKTTTVESVDVFVDTTTTVGNTIQAILFIWVDGTPEAFAESEPLVIEEEHLGTWVNFTFVDDTEIVVDLENGGSYNILAAVKHFYTASNVPDGERSLISIGMDKSTNFGAWSGWYRVLQSGEWKWYYGATDGKALGIRLNVSNSIIVNDLHVCEGDIPYTWGEMQLETTGVYTQEIDGNTHQLSFFVHENELIEETHEICEGSEYTWHGVDYTEEGIYTAQYTTIYGCDSIYTLNLTVNPGYYYTEEYNICEGEVYSWQGQNYSEAGTYTAEYASIHGCDSIYTLNLISNSGYSYEEDHSICEGEVYTWHGQTYSETGTYTAEYTTIYGCDSIHTLNLTVNPLPQQVVVLQTPSNGILPEGTNGSITLSTSIVGTNYWVTMGGALFTNEISGTGASLSLGENYPSGSYDVKSRTQHNCSLVQGTVNFTTGTNGNTGAGKIVANITFGTPASNFPANHVKVKLYKKAI
ncbi:MAG TPA: hypothetical protein PLG05_09645, partial [Bacteroidales bacterium]|nr:hypothetical protein [Bacteroidales bacterium]